ncbi:MAG: class I SAM-dependent methyltransferase [Myxococcota bacterium]
MSTSWLPWSPPIELPGPTRARDRWARSLVWRALTRLERGVIEVHDGEGCRAFGRAAGDLDLRVRVEVRDPRFYGDLVGGGVLGAGEAWIDGRWGCDDLPALVRILLRNQECMGGIENPLVRGLALARDTAARLRRNGRAKSRRQIAAHYDLGNDFFAQFLDPTLTYSAGLFEHPDASLEQASLAKIDRLCRWLELGPDDHLLEIGTGWGAFALRAASKFGCRVTTTTLSREQAAFARERVERAGLGSRIEVLEQDYRDLEGRYDKLVSVEMIEAVGHAHFETYFRRCEALLEPAGLMAIQAIVIADRHYEAARSHDDFIKRYVFPGGCLPSLEVIGRHVGRSTALRIRRTDDVTAHYAETLRRWRSAFHEAAPTIRALGHSEPFMRLWDFYLAYCEGGFEERHIGTVQMLLAGEAWRERSPAPAGPSRPAPEAGREGDATGAARDRGTIDARTVPA